MKFVGIKKVEQQTRNLREGNHLQVNYDRKAGEVWGNECVGDESWVRYDNPDIILVANLCGYVSMNDLKQMVIDRCEFLDYEDLGRQTRGST